MGRRFGGMIGGAVLTAAPLVLGTMLALQDGPGLQGLRNLVFDGFQRLAPRPAQDDLVRVVHVDDESLRRIGQWPWPRDRIAEAVERLGGLGARVVALDILFTEPDRTSPEEIVAALPAGAEREAVARILSGRSHDAALARAMGSTPTVLGFALSDFGGQPPPAGTAGFAFLGGPPQPFLPRFGGAIPTLPVLAAAARGQGAVNWIPDRDLVVRRVPLLFDGDGRVVPSLALETLRVAQGGATAAVSTTAAGVAALRVGSTVVPTDADSSVRIRYAAGREQRAIPFWRVVEPGALAREEVEGRIVLIGTSAMALGDVKATPLDASVPGVDIHAEVIGQVLQGQFLVRPDYARGIEIAVLLLGSVVAVLLARTLRPVGAALGLVALLGGLWIGAFAAFVRGGLVLEPVVPGATIVAAFAVATVIVFRRTEGERRQIREAFSHYVSPEIVRTLSRDPSLLKLGGQTRPLSILFFDLRGFTPFAESMPAEAVIRFLNAMHTPLTQAVLEENGTIDKYIGDGLLAFWNAPVDVPDHAARACRAALRMAEALPAIRSALAAEIGEEALATPLGLGIGLHTGFACVGNMGSALRFDYSIVGDAVNTAARLEPLTKAYGVPILVSDDVREAAPGFAFLAVDVLRLKGQARETRIHALLGTLEAAGEEFPAFAAAHHRALDAVRSGAPGAEGLIALLERHPIGAELGGTYAAWRLSLSAGAASDADHERVVAGG
ncbi:CHASE2 domain-containing protein [Alsobacter sp. R-9]